MNNTIRKSETATMVQFNNLFIEMSGKNCNQRCKHCYIKFPQYKKIQDFIKIETVSEALNTLSEQKLECIYLTGAEPMTHPNFNSILRLCLKKTNVCICTNGSFINEKKARFLKKVENESNNEIFFEISLDHYDEIKNDDIRYRGAYRQAVFAIKHLSKYNFSPIIHVTNYYNETQKVLIENIVKKFDNINCEISENHIKITPYFDITANNEDLEIRINPDTRLDCRFGRVLSEKGIYSCPFLSGDYRGRCGSTFKNFSDNISLETEYCATCIQNGYEIFGIFPEQFE